MYIDKLDDIVNEYSNTYRRSIKIKFIVIKANKYFDISVINDNNNPKFEVSDWVIISKYGTCFAKGYTLKENLKILYYGRNVCHRKNLIVKKCLQYLMKKNCKKQTSRNIELRK